MRMENKELTDPRHFLHRSRRPLILYGAGGYGFIYADYLRLFGLDFTAFCDSDPEKQGKRVYGVETISPEELAKTYPDANVILTVSQSLKAEIAASLAALEFPPERILMDNSRYVVGDGFETERFAVNMFADLYRFRGRLADDESRRLFSRRYRHWVLGDRGDNDESDARTPGGILFYPAAEYFCDQLERVGAEAAAGDLAVEFSNDDALVPPRILGAVLFYRPRNRFYLRPGSDTRSTRLLSLAEDSPHAV